MIGRLNHVAIVVPSVAAAAAVYRDTLGATVSAPQPLPAHGVTVVFVTLPNTKIELLEPLGLGPCPCAASWSAIPRAGCITSATRSRTFGRRGGQTGRRKVPACSVPDGDSKLGAHRQARCCFCTPRISAAPLIELEQAWSPNGTGLRALPPMLWDSAWVVISTILPWGVRPAEDEMSQRAGAPANPRLGLMAVVTTGIAAGALGYPL